MSTQAKEVKKADKLLKELEVLVNPDKTPKPRLDEIEAVWSICRKLTGVTDQVILMNMEIFNTTMLVFILSSIIYLIRKTTTLCHDVDSLKNKVNNQNYVNINNFV